MLYNKINLSTTYGSCLINDINYAFSLHSYIVKEDNKNYMYVELDSFLKYAGITDIESAISEIKQVERIKLETRKIHFTTRNFVYYKHLNPAIAMIHFNLRKSGESNNMLKYSLGYLYSGIVTSWKDVKDRIFDLLDSIQYAN